MNQIILNGIASGNSFDDRTLLILSVTLNDEVFEWSVRVHPSYTGSFGEYPQIYSDQIYADIQNKLNHWDALTPKTRDVVMDADVMGNEQTITVPIQRDEIVRPTYPDYYVFRAREYPSVAEQLDAYWKGGTAQQDMQQRIQNIKLKYPKE